jgi:hypothetical protein
MKWQFGVSVEYLRDKVLSIAGRAAALKPASGVKV